MPVWIQGVRVPVRCVRREVERLSGLGPTYRSNDVGDSPMKQPAYQ